MIKMFMVLALAVAARALETNSRLHSSESNEVLGGEQLFLLTDLEFSHIAIEPGESCEEAHSRSLEIILCFKASRLDDEVRCEAWPSTKWDSSFEWKRSTTACNEGDLWDSEERFESKEREIRCEEWDYKRLESRASSNKQEITADDRIGTETSKKAEKNKMTEKEIYAKTDFWCFLGSLHLGNSTVYIASDDKVRVFLGLREDQLGSGPSQNQFKAEELSEKQVYSLKTEQKGYPAKNLAILKSNIEDAGSSIELGGCDCFYYKAKEARKQEDTSGMGNEKFEAQRHLRLLSSLTIPGHYMEKQFTKAVSETNQHFGLGLSYDMIYILFVNFKEHIEYLRIKTFIEETYGFVFDTSSNDEKIEDISSVEDFNSDVIFTYVTSMGRTKTIYRNSVKKKEESLIKTITTTGEVTASDTIINSDKHIIVWSDTSIDGDGSYGIAGINSDEYFSGTSAEFKINTNIRNDQIRPKVAIQGSGYIVAWQSNHQDGSSYAIYAQKFYEDSTKDGSEFRLSGEGNYSYYDVNISSYIFYPSEYVAVWVRESCSEKRIECKTDISSIFLVDTNTQPGTESVTPWVSASGNEFTVTWVNKSPDSDYGTIYMRRFDEKGNPKGNIITVATDAKLPKIIGSHYYIYAIAWISSSNNLEIRELRKCTVNNCDSCPENYRTCSNCVAGYYLNKKNRCKACGDANCIECADDLTCNACNAGFYLDENSCKECKDPNCRDCPDSSTCNDCNPGFFLSGNACNACTSPCVECTVSGADQCTMCECNTRPSTSPGWCECIPGTYESSTDPLNCSDCHSSCVECSGPSETECTVCSSGNDPFETGGRCVCASGTYETASNPLTCSRCDPTCATCENSASNCLSCHSYFNFNCCPDGTYMDEFRCLKCSDDCETCETSAEKCLSCPGEANCCPEGTFFSQSDCIACGEKCSSCDEVGCLTCIEDSKDCCPKTRFLNTSSSTPKCEDCVDSDNIGCTKCPPNTNCCGERAQSGENCVVCGENCFTCDEVGCLTCSADVDCCEGLRVYDSNSDSCYCPYGSNCLTCDVFGCLTCVPGIDCCVLRIFNDENDSCSCDDYSGCLFCDDIGCTTCPTDENCCGDVRVFNNENNTCSCNDFEDCLTCDEEGCLTCVPGTNCCGERTQSGDSCAACSENCLTCDEVGCLTCPTNVDCCEGLRVYEESSDSCYCPYGSNCLTCDEVGCLTCVPGIDCCVLRIFNEENDSCSCDDYSGCLFCDDIGCTMCPTNENCCGDVRVFNKENNTCSCNDFEDCLTCDEEGCLTCVPGSNCCGERTQSGDSCVVCSENCLTCDEVGCLTCPTSEDCCGDVRVFNEENNTCNCPFSSDCLTCDGIGCLTCPEGVDCCVLRIFNEENNSCGCEVFEDCLGCDQERCLICVPGTNCCGERDQIGDSCL